MSTAVQVIQLITALPCRRPTTHVNASDRQRDDDIMNLRGKPRKPTVSKAFSPPKLGQNAPIRLPQATLFAPAGQPDRVSPTGRGGDYAAPVRSASCRTGSRPAAGRAVPRSGRDSGNAESATR